MLKILEIVCFTLHYPLLHISFIHMFHCLAQMSFFTRIIKKLKRKFPSDRKISKEMRPARKISQLLVDFESLIFSWKKHFFQIFFIILSHIYASRVTTSYSSPAASWAGLYSQSAAFGLCQLGMCDSPIGSDDTNLRLSTNQRPELNMFQDICW